MGGDSDRALPTGGGVVSALDRAAHAAYQGMGGNSPWDELPSVAKDRYRSAVRSALGSVVAELEHLGSPHRDRSAAVTLRILLEGRQ